MIYVPLANRGDAGITGDGGGGGRGKRWLIIRMLLGDTELVTLAGENAKTKSQEEEKHIFSIKNSSPSDHPGVTDQI